jgi:release factor glutamine methyltransferase
MPDTSAKTRESALTVRGALREGIARLGGAGVPSHALAAELLLLHSLGHDRAWVYSHPEAALDGADAAKYLALIARRAEGVPTQYLIGKQEFWGLEFEVNPRVLIPRPETEHVVEVALRRTRLYGGVVDIRSGAPARKIRVADVGTGSGCIAIALAAELSSAEIVATDISSTALEVARRNAARHGVGDRIQFVEADLLRVADSAPVTCHPPLLFDLIVSNPPYVARHAAAGLSREVREHEPDAALYGGPAGTEMYARLIEQASELLVRGGNVVLELGYDSAARVREIFEGGGAWARVEITPDLAAIPRVIAATRA